jgi:hypothetical protein
MTPVSRLGYKKNREKYPRSPSTPKPAHGRHRFPGVLVATKVTFSFFTRCHPPQSPTFRFSIVGICHKSPPFCWSPFVSRNKGRFFTFSTVITRDKASLFHFSIAVIRHKAPSFRFSTFVAVNKGSPGKFTPYRQQYTDKKGSRCVTKGRAPRHKDEF